MTPNVASGAADDVIVVDEDGDDEEKELASGSFIEFSFVFLFFLSPSPPPPPLPPLPPPPPKSGIISAKKSTSSADFSSFFLTRIAFTSNSEPKSLLAFAFVEAEAPVVDVEAAEAPDGEALTVEAEPLAADGELDSLSGFTAVV